MLTPKILKLQKKMSEVVASINIKQIIGHIVIDDTGKIPTACWIFNKKTQEFIIKVSAELVESLDIPVLRLVVEHELLHHVRYQNCDDRNAIMSNIVLDTAINKTLYLYKPSDMVKLSKAIYRKNEEDYQEMVKTSPLVLACPLLTADDINKIENPKIKALYIKTWGSRETSKDYDYTIPNIFDLFYSLVDVITEEQASENGQFGEYEEKQDGEEGKEGKEGKSKSIKKKGKMKRCSTDEDEQDEDGSGSSGNEKDSGEKEEKDGEFSSEKEKDDNDKDDSSEKGKDEDSSKGKGKDGKSSDDGEEKKDDNGNSKGEEDKLSKSYSKIVEDIDGLEKSIEKAASKKAGKGKSNIKFNNCVVDLDRNTSAIEKRLQELRIAETIDMVSNAVRGTMGDEVAYLPYITRPTNSTLTHIAFGLDKYMPMYWNKTHAGMPKMAVYVDVSGSMSSYGKMVQSIVVRIMEYLPSVIFLFDTGIIPIDTKIFEKQIPSGGGTSLSNVLNHASLTTEERQEWLKNLLNKSTATKNKYRGWGTITESTYVSGGMLDSQVMREEAPAVFIITDGEAHISQEIIEKFRHTNKKLTVLQINNTDNTFENFATQVFYVNYKGEIIKTVGYNK